MNTTSPTPIRKDMDMSRFLRPEDLCERFPGTTRQSWAQQRYLGSGPRYFKVGGKIFYRAVDLDAWVESQLRTRTDDEVASC